MANFAIGKEPSMSKVFYRMVDEVSAQEIIFRIKRARIPFAHAAVPRLESVVFKLTPEAVARLPHDEDYPYLPCGEDHGFGVIEKDGLDDFYETQAAHAWVEE